MANGLQSRPTGLWFAIVRPAARECGHRGFVETRVTQRRGARWSTADAYLKPALQRKNLTLHTEATATRVIFDGNQAVGVEFEQLGARRVVNVRREVVLCGGAINSPQLLMLSGVGAGDQLAEHGIDVVTDAPDVGANLLDHLIVPLGFDVPNDRQIILDSMGAPACYCLFPANRPLTHQDLVACVASL